MGLKTAYQKQINDEPRIEQEIHRYEDYVNSTNTNIIEDKVFNRLNNIVNVNKLNSFYSIEKIKKLSKSINREKMIELSQKFKISNEEDILKLIPLCLYDIILYIDDSGSIIFDNDKDDRYEDLKIIINKIADIITIFDEDGISIRFINSNEKPDGITSKEQINDVLKKCEFKYSTPLGRSLENKIVKNDIYNLFNKNNTHIKPLLIITITDGQPDYDDNPIKDVIKNVKKYIKNLNLSENTVEFSFAQVGKDRKAQEFLDDMDDDYEIGDMVDVTSYYEIEQKQFEKNGREFTPQLWLIKLLVGSIDPAEDEKDEKKKNDPPRYRF